MAKKPVSVSVISIDEIGLFLDVTYVDRPTERISKVTWPEIQSIRVYNRDLLAYDLICMELEIEDERFLELHEEMDGWDALVNSLHEFLPGCESHSDWWHPVAVPAFETNLKEVYRRIRELSV